MERRQNYTERLTSVHLQKIQQRFVQFESRLNDSKHKTDKRIEELESRINQQCSRPTEKHNPSTTPTTGFHHTVTPRPSAVPPPAGREIFMSVLEHLYSILQAVSVGLLVGLSIGRFRKRF